MVKLHAKKTVVCSIEVQCEIGSLGLLNLPPFNPENPTANTSMDQGAFSIVTYVGDVLQDQQQSSLEPEGRLGAADA